MIGRKRKQNDNGNPGLDISSLIDVSFLLLIYFLITSTLDPREGDLGMDLAGIPVPGSIVTPDRPMIEVDPAGNVLFEQELVETDVDSRRLIHLEDRLRTYVEAYSVLTTNGEPSVALNVDDSVPGQRFIDVINCLAAAGIDDIALVNFEGE